MKGKKRHKKDPNRLSRDENAIFKMKYTELD